MTVVAAAPLTRMPVARPGRAKRSPPRRLAARGARALRVAMLAPPWISVPPPGYGGVEAVIAGLTDALVARGHEVTLYCAPGSRSAAHTVSLLAHAHADEIERSLYESDHVARAFTAIDAAREQGCGFDVVHDHCGFTAFAMADRLSTPLLHTLHGPFTAQTSAFYAHHADNAWVAGISETQLAAGPANLRSVGAIPNPIDVRSWPFREHKDGYLLWIGRMTAEKGPQRAIAVARSAGLPLVLAGVVQPGQREFFERHVAPHLDGDRVRFVGEIGGAAKQALFAGAEALLMPIRWPEPFGMVMIEALVCGTPVIAFQEGAACELVTDGHTGYLVEDETAMASAVHDRARIDPRDCRDWVAARCDVDVVAAAYERAYRTTSTAQARLSVLAAGG